MYCVYIYVYACMCIHTITDTMQDQEGRGTYTEEYAYRQPGADRHLLVMFCDLFVCACCICVHAVGASGDCLMLYPICVPVCSYVAVALCAYYM